jgi:hypothetical protein
MEVVQFSVTTHQRQLAVSRRCGSGDFTFRISAALSASPGPSILAELRNGSGSSIVCLGAGSAFCRPWAIEVMVGGCHRSGGERMRLE